MDPYSRHHHYYTPDFDNHNNMRYTTNNHYLPQSSSRHDDDYLIASAQPRYNGYERHAPPVHEGYHYDQAWQNSHIYPTGYEVMGDDDDELDSYAGTSPATSGSPGGGSSGRSRHNSIESSTTTSTSNSTHKPRHTINTINIKPSPTTVASKPASSVRHTTTSTSHSSTDTRPSCPHPACISPTTGLPQKYFSRRADVARHFRSMHEPSHIDCPRRNCARKGEGGFTRRDHLVEHLRGYHGESIERRRGGGGGGGGVGGREEAR